MTLEPAQSDGTRIGVIDDAGGERFITLAEFCALLNVDGWVRMHPADFAAAAALGRHFTHFNLATTANKVGLRYALVPIARAGYRSEDGVEVLPFVGLSAARSARCIEIRQSVLIADLGPADFQHSLPSIQTPDQLRAVLIDRYAKMHPGLPQAELLQRGCAISTFEFDRASTLSIDDM